MVLDSESFKIYNGIRGIPKNEWRDPVMEKSDKEAMSATINEALTSAIASLSEKYPGYDIELLIARNLLEKQGASIRRSEVDHFKNLAMSTLGTENEMHFDDAERGFLEAALADGRAGLKEYIERIPVEAPTGGDGAKMVNRGIEKKT